MSDFNPGVGGINHLDYAPGCEVEGCAEEATYFYRWALQCKCSWDGLLCGPHTDEKRAVAAAVKGITPVLCGWCGLFTYGHVSVLLECAPIPAPGKRMK